MGACFHKGEFNDDQLDMIKDCTGMSADQVKIWYDQFNKTYSNGHIPKKAFVHELQKLKKDIPVHKYLTERIFSAFDKDDSGEISFGEFLVGATAVLGPTSEQKLKYLFTIYDKNGDWMLSRKEIRKILRILLVGRVQTEHEVDQYVNTILTNADTNDDKLISLNEFLTICKKDSTLLDLMNPFA